MAGALKPIRVLLVENQDQTMIRAGLRLLLETQSRHVVVGEAGQRDAALQLVAEARPDIILINLIDCGADELALLEDILAASPGARAIALLPPCEAAVEQSVVRGGALGIVSKDKPPAVLYQAIEQVHAGEIWLTRSAAATALTTMSRVRSGNSGDPQDRIATLTDREQEVIALVGEGLKNKAIADRLFVSEAAVRHRLTSIFTKLELADRLELVVFSYHNGLARLPK